MKVDSVTKMCRRGGKLQAQAKMVFDIGAGSLEWPLLGGDQGLDQEEGSASITIHTSDINLPRPRLPQLFPASGDLRGLRQDRLGD
jgi:hypothetical protein